ncbi:MAG TPA: hypothetical protein QF528_04140 [Phycisphaerales bacterium]|jgi:hypothetical protein|nr:hypothetical protein [Phycisphaerales bacterium]|tara:strand:+ start:129 stop:470 length:342 start_codon:yes stop_codon:yes gene_type:complete
MTTEEPNKEIEKIDEAKQEGIPTFVTPLQPIAKQVGEHVMTALEDKETVAVLTTVTGSAAGQQVVSIPLTSEHLQQVHGLIEEIHTSDEPERVPCVGFHCFLDNNEGEDNNND